MIGTTFYLPSVGRQKPDELATRQSRKIWHLRLDQMLTVLT